MIRKKYCGTAAKAGGNGENKPHPKIMGVPYLLEKRTRYFGIISAVALGIAACQGVSEDWPQFRGPGGLGISAVKNLPVTWSDSENLVWKTAMPGAGSSSPIVLKGKIYVTCYSGYGSGVKDAGEVDDLMLHLICINGDGGRIVWDKSFKPDQPESKSVRDHGYAAATPVTDGKHIYCFFGKSGVMKFDMTGKQLWQTRVGDKTHGWGCGTSPVLHDNLVIVNASVESRSLVAINKTTGKEVWRAGGMDSSWNTPHLVRVADGKWELAVSIKGFILGFDPATGKELWRCKGIPDYICPSIISHNGVLYALGGRTSKAIAVRPGGRGDVTATHKLWQASVGANVSSPIVYNGHLYWVSDRNQTAYCLDLDDGAIKYEQKVRSQPYASPLLADGRLYVVTRYGGTLVLAAKPSYEELAHNKLSDKSVFNASPTICNGNLILRSDHYLYAFGKGE